MATPTAPKFGRRYHTPADVPKPVRRRHQRKLRAQERQVARHHKVLRHQDLDDDHEEAWGWDKTEYVWCHQSQTLYQKRHTSFGVVLDFVRTLYEPDDEDCRH